MHPQQIVARLHELLMQVGQYADDLVIEDIEANMLIGVEQVMAPGNRVAHGPLVAGAHFSVGFKLDVTFKPAGKRFVMEEIAVYKVADGKIVYEEFFYNM